MRSSRMPPETSTCTPRTCLITLRSIAGVAAATEGGVEVDEVDPVGALAREVERGVDGVAVVGLGAGLALREADGLAAGDIDSGQQDQFGR